ncbi:unnamed protein product [Ixodes persulcatus]
MEDANSGGGTPQFSPSPSGLKECVEYDLALFYLKLESKYCLPASTVQHLWQEIENLHGSSKQCMFKALYDRLEERLGTADAKEIVADANSHDVFSSLNATVFNSEHKRRAYFKQKVSYVQPVQIYLGRDGNKRDCSFQYVPVLETLKSLLQNGSLADCILNTSLDDRDASYMKDISDGSAYKSNPLFKTRLPTFKLLLYQDAFEVVNPLGSARKKHKLVGAYFTLANLKKKQINQISHSAGSSFC